MAVSMSPGTTGWLVTKPNQLYKCSLQQAVRGLQLERPKTDLVPAAPRELSGCGVGTSSSLPAHSAGKSMGMLMVCLDLSLFHVGVNI